MSPNAEGEKETREGWPSTAKMHLLPQVGLLYLAPPPCQVATQPRGTGWLLIDPLLLASCDLPSAPWMAVPISPPPRSNPASRAPSPFSGSGQAQGKEQQLQFSLRKPGPCPFWGVGGGQSIGVLVPMSPGGKERIPEVDRDASQRGTQRPFPPMSLTRWRLYPLKGAG